MVNESVEAYVHQDLALARAVIQYDVWWTILLQDPGGANRPHRRQSQRGEEALDLLMIAKYLERIGDHATNIAEWVEFSILGHHPKDE